MNHRQEPTFAAVRPTIALGAAVQVVPIPTPRVSVVRRLISLWRSRPNG